MLTIETLPRVLTGLPGVVRLGLGLMAFGGAADVVAHLGIAEAAASIDGHTVDERAAHLVGFVGMVVVLLGVVLDGVRGSRPGRLAEDSSKGGI